MLPAQNIAHHRDRDREYCDCRSHPTTLHDPCNSNNNDDDDDDDEPPVILHDALPPDGVARDPHSWGASLPAQQGLYCPEYERDACGVGFICQIKGKPSHKIVSDARHLLCAMAHRGATGADSRDGDGAGVMTSIPHAFFKREAERELGSLLPEPGKYAVGNVFLKPNDPTEQAKQKSIFTSIANQLGLTVLGWRSVPTDTSILGPAASSREPSIWQPFVVLSDYYGDGSDSDDAKFGERHFERQLYVLRKHATHTMYVNPISPSPHLPISSTLNFLPHVLSSSTLAKWFYICSLSSKNIVYKGQLTCPQVYNYYHDLNHVLFSSHFALVHSRFSTNTFPSWDRAQPMRWAAHNGRIQFLQRIPLSLISPSSR